MRAAIYARFSTDKQSDSSIEDQGRNCERYAERADMQIVMRFEDRAISGASKERPGYQDMLLAAKNKEFDVLLTDDLSRLSRDEIEVKQTIRRFKFCGTRIIGVSDGYDSATKGEKIQSTMRGLMNEMYLDDLREKTHRGMYGKALGGYSAGGRTYGYKRAPIEDATKLDANGRPEIVAVRREINEDEARWVRQMFEWFATGHSPKWIAAELNRLGVPSTRGSTWAASAVYGDMTQGNGLLNNELYIGNYIWNRSAWVKNPDTGRRKRMERKQSDWVRTPLPELRIVPQELWDAVKARQQKIRGKSVNLRQALNNPSARSHSGKYLFSGLLKCACCGANFTIWGSTSYACATNVQRGDAACANRLRVPRHIVEERLVEAIKGELLTDEAIDLFVKETTRLLKQKQSERTTPDDTAARELAQAEKVINNLMAALKAGIFTPTTKSELERAEAARDRAKALLGGRAARSPEAYAAALPDAAERFKGLVGNLYKNLQRDIPQARQCLGTLVGAVRLHPHEDGYLQAELRQNPEGLIGLAKGQAFNIGMVVCESGGLKARNDYPTSIPKSQCREHFSESIHAGF